MADVELGPDLEGFVRKQIERGRFRNASEVVQAGLRLLEQHDGERAERIAVIRQKIDSSLRDSRPSLPSEEVFARLERKHAARLQTAGDEP